MTNEQLKTIEKFLEWFSKEGYEIFCQYDEHTSVYIPADGLIKDYVEYLEEENLLKPIDQ